MKKSILLNSNISHQISCMRHKDQIVIGDAGLPVPQGVSEIDLAITRGVPDFFTVLKTVLSELCIEKIILAEELKTAGPESIKIHDGILSLVKLMEAESGIKVETEYVTHEVFKSRTAESKAVIRTGEFTPYSNIILVSGVVF
ncbi:D-ribose pyranase [Anoxybacterium hadale]|uniref:D-ribose pyranase n=1 Tax=Anoxybacterium hadale TaxID=3408580 RepID=A0ACD1A8Q2_9FIRM|nr:D-ribose pyranase [Clostridiales bacterium]